jgi:hypothetical protein
MNNTIPALQSLIARNRNELREWHIELYIAIGYRSYLSAYPSYYKWEEKDIVNNIRNCKQQIASLERIQKVAKQLLNREYAEERIRAFNKECQRMRNK